ncbi:MAG: S41 family peptidase [Candidatus Kapabacteria bacterium]|jgi:C-terminal processing protease CtpA/Prc|nr:S41 family peptidase [Candidatus Kapabacteria bacterium]
MTIRTGFVAAIIVCTVFFSACTQQQPTQPTTTTTTQQTTATQWFSGGRITDIYSNTNAANLNLSDFLYLGMRDIYYWNSRVPENLALSSFPTPDSLLNFTIARPEDRFSGIIQDGVGYYNRLTMGTSSPIFGFGTIYSASGEVRFTRVLGGSSADQAGIKRGMRLISVDGAAIPGTVSAWNSMIANLGMTATLVVEDASGTRKTVTLMRSVFNEIVVPVVRTYTVAGKKVGYIVLTSFTQSAVNELQTAFATLKNDGVTELVLDLRYNGGGSVATAGVLCSHIASQLSGTPYVRLTYNSRYAPNNQQFAMTSQSNGLSLTRLFVVMTQQTASASELTINALRPYIDVKTVGSRSFGKPVGSNIVIHQKSGYMLLPISFAYTNALGQADFINGFAPDIPAVDDVTRDFGDPQEASLRAALFFIENGRAPVAAKSTSQLNASETAYTWEKGQERIPALLLPKK